MEKETDYSAAVSETASMLQKGDIESATRLSGEALANCDNDLREAYNKSEALNDKVLEFMDMATLHVRCLRMAGLAGEAFECAVGALLTPEIYRAADKIDEARKACLYFDMVRSAIDMFDHAGDACDSITEDHRGYIMSYAASLLYYNYSKAVEAGSDNPQLAEIYSFLKSIASSGAIQSPKIRLGDTEVDPSDAGPILVDIMSRAAAL